MVNVRFIRINNSINYIQVLNDEHYATVFISRRIKRDTVLSKNLACPHKFVGSPSHQKLQSWSSIYLELTTSVIYPRFNYYLQFQASIYLKPARQGIHHTSTAIYIYIVHSELDQGLETLRRVSNCTIAHCVDTLPTNREEV